MLALEQLVAAQPVDARGAWRWPSARRPGCRARPSRGQCSSAATSASCASSSARPTSRTMRARPAMSCADSMRQTASIAPVRRLGVAVSGCSGVFSAPAADAHVAEALDRRAVGRSRRARYSWRTSISRPTCAERRREAPRPLERFVARAHLDDPEAGDQLLGLGERAVDHRALAAVDSGCASPSRSAAGRRRRAARRPSPAPRGSRPWPPSDGFVGHARRPRTARWP